MAEPVAADPPPRAIAGLDFVVGAMLLVSKIMIVAMALHIVADMALRAISTAALGATIEIASNYYMVALTFLPLAYIQRRRGHLVAEVFTQRLPARGRRVLDAAMDVALAVFLGLMAVKTGEAAMAATAAREYVELPDSVLPIWPAKWLVPAGFGAMALCALAQAAAAMLRAAPGGREAGA
ncbi:MAG: TRAP transporter small permease [Rhodospirillaceae bacterium]|nr:TRAP transporter small permease [Rhodospirillaceae bacterium]